MSREASRDTSLLIGKILAFAPKWECHLVIKALLGVLPYFCKLHLPNEKFLEVFVLGATYDNPDLCEYVISALPAWAEGGLPKLEDADDTPQMGLGWVLDPRGMSEETKRRIPKLYLDGLWDVTKRYPEIVAESILDGHGAEDEDNIWREMSLAFCDFIFEARKAASECSYGDQESW